MFKKLSKADYDKQLKEVQKEKELFDKRKEIDEVKRSMRRWNPPTTTKIIMFFIFANCTVVEVYAMWVMWYLMNLDALYALISAVVGESVSFAVYAAKAYNETKQEELIKLERDKMENEEIESEDAVG